VRVTVLGKSPSWPDAGGACSGYLIEQDGYALLLDCGGGAFGKLRAHYDYMALEAVLITHMHSDHFFDLVPFSYALTLSPRAAARDGADAGDGGARRPTLHLPPGGRSVLRAMLGAWSKEDLVESAFEVSEYDPAGGLTLGPLQARFCEVPHYTTTFAVQLRAGGASFTYGADTGPSPALVQFAHGSEMLMLEATLAEPEPGPRRGHLSAREAGELGSAAQARRLVLTHFSDELDVERMRAEGEAGFGTGVELAAEGAVYEL